LGGSRKYAGVGTTAISIIFSMTIKLSEKIIRERAVEQSFQKGLAYYLSGAIYEPTWQSIPNGIMLMAFCEGSSAPSYQLSVKLDAEGVRSASCTCPYDWGGDCKHIVALLLTYLRQPEKFTVQKSVTELLSGLEKDALAEVIIRLVERNPDLYDDLEIIIPSVTAAKSKSDPSKERQHTQVSEQVYRKQVKRILKQSRYEDGDEYGSVPTYLDDLEEVRKTAQQFLDANDAQGALIILLVLLEETIDDYESEMDYDGDVASFIQSLGLPLAEAILSVEMDDQSYQSLYASIEESLKNLDESIEESELEVITVALDYGWTDLPDQESQWEEYDEDTWMLFDELQQARLNVLERQKRVDEFLQLAQKANKLRYILKLLQLGRYDDAIIESQALINEQEIFSVAQQLRETGHISEALALAERALQQPGQHNLELATWLAPLEENRGETNLALLAYHAAFDVQPAITWYRHLKRLSGKNWERLRPELMKRVNENTTPDTLADIYLEEQDWDAAIAMAEKISWPFNLLEKVADGVLAHRPDWVIRLSLKQAEELILKTQSNLYPSAAKWLLRAKKAYQIKGQANDWQSYISNLRANYARRPALQKAISGL
jgi:uncharacterized Zn finger protein